ncbi:MAG: T9SS type A sorting domain-containing protein, partial [Aureispira sp.]
AGGVAAGDYGVTMFPAPIDASTGGPMAALVDGGFYYVSVQINPSLTGGVAGFGVNDVPLHGVDNLNYAMNIGKTTTTVPFAPSTMRVVDAAGAESWFAGFTGFDETPSIGVFFSSSAFVNVDKLPSTLEGSLSLYPNPASDFLQVEIQLESTTDVQYVITDMAGRVVYYDNSENISQEIVTVDVSTLVAGVYMVSAQTDKGVTTKRFVKK